MPGRSRTRFERDERAAELRWSGRLEQRIDADVAGEVLDWPFMEAREPLRLISMSPPFASDQLLYPILAYSDCEPSVLDGIGKH